MTNHTKKQHWGTVDQENKLLLHQADFSDEYLWEFTTTEDILFCIIDQQHVNDFLASGGGFSLIDIPDPLPRFHKISIWAHHNDAKWLTWINLLIKLP